MAVSANAWALRGTVFLWRYRENVKNFPGWHLAANPEGSLALLELFGAVRESSTSIERYGSRHRLARSWLSQTTRAALHVGGRLQSGELFSTRARNPPICGSFPQTSTRQFFRSARVRFPIDARRHGCHERPGRLFDRKARGKAGGERPTLVLVASSRWPF